MRKHGYSKRRTWRKVHLSMDTKTGQICAALMTHQDVGDGEVLTDRLDQIPADTPIDTIGGDGAYDSKPCHAAIDARGAVPSIPPREGAMPWADGTPGAAWRNAAIGEIAQSSRREWKQASKRLPQAFVGGEPDVPTQDTHWSFPVGARSRLPSRSRRATFFDFLKRTTIKNECIHLRKPSQKYEARTQTCLP